MDYLILMLALSLTLVNVGIAFFVVWLVSQLFPDMIHKLRDWMEDRRGR